MKSTTWIAIQQLVTFMFTTLATKSFNKKNIPVSRTINTKSIAAVYYYCRIVEGFENAGAKEQYLSWKI